ncbi:hypothetical protein INR49_025042 [Caranx melampygus]|nr:hypothetical protein INR49_025042 [Caranx melampygus]
MFLRSSLVENTGQIINDRLRSPGCRLGAGRRRRGKMWPPPVAISNPSVSHGLKPLPFPYHFPVPLPPGTEGEEVEGGGGGSGGCCSNDIKTEKSIVHSSSQSPPPLLYLCSSKRPVGGVKPCPSHSLRVKLHSLCLNPIFLLRARAGRATKAGGGEGGGGEGVKVKRTSIADLIRPLREAKERERERERDKEREKERGARSVEDANVSNDAATTEGTVATNDHLAAHAREAMAPANALTMTTPPSETTPPCPTITTSPDSITATLSNLEEEAVPALPGRTPSPVVTSPLTEQERSGMLMKEMKLGGTPYGERRLNVTKRSLREGKSQSLILLTGPESEDKDNAHSKKHASESTPSFEQRLQVMLHRMGVAKTPPAETKTSQVLSWTNLNRLPLT